MPFRTIYWFLLVMVAQPINIFIMFNLDWVIGVILFVWQIPYIVANYRGNQHNKTTQ